MSELPLEKELASLPDDIRWLFQRADGFLDLRLPSRAREELDRVPERFCDSQLFRTLALRTACDLKDWRSAVVLAETLRLEHPQEPGYWIQLAYAIRRADGIDRARQVLTAAQEKFPEVATIAFNLACYDCPTGRNAEARVHLQRAITLEPACHAAALEDEDLMPLWPELE